MTFVKVNSDDQREIAQEHSVSSLPTFLIFRDGKVDQKIQGANPAQLKAAVEKLAYDVESLGEGSGSAGGDAGTWKGADIPRGYSDITDQVEIKGCELLNSDEGAGPVKVLFENTKPRGLDKTDKTGPSSSAKDWVQSGADDQLLLFIPFQSTIKLHTLQVGRHQADQTRCTQGTDLSPPSDHIPAS